MGYCRANPSAVGKRGLSLILAGLLFAPGPAAAAELKARTIAAYDRYVKHTEARIAAHLQPDQPFLWLDRVPQATRNVMLADLAKGNVLIEARRMREANGKELAIPDGMVHHWIGLVHIPGATLPQVLALMQDYNSHATVYKPEVVRARELERNGDFFRIFYRFYKHKVISVTVDTDQEVFYESLGDKRATCRSYTTRIAEVENPGEKDEKLKPVGKDGGYMWRLHTWWRLEERDGGVYVECEATSLTRDIPFGFGWLVGPFVKSIPRESLQFTLGTTRTFLLARHAEAANTPGSRP